MQDYSDQPHHRGLMMYTREQLQELTTLTAAKGWQLNVHAIGDAGNRIVLDTFETLLDESSNVTRCVRASSTRRSSRSTTSAASRGSASSRRCSRRTRRPT